jgi:coproporphyrinogen III oxidase
MEIEGVFDEIMKITVNGIESIDGKREWRKKKWETPPGVFDVSTYRGKTIEKASIGRVSLKAERVTVDTGETINQMLIEGLQLNIFASNPRLPVGMFNLEKRVTSSESLGGYVSILPLKDNDELVGGIKNAFSSTVEKYGKDEVQVLKDYGELWKGLDWPLKGEKEIGVKIIGDESELDFVTDMMMLMVKAYLDCISMSKDVAFGKDDEERMFSLRLRLTEFLLIKDASAQMCFKNGVPMETLSTTFLPPVVKF